MNFLLVLSQVLSLLLSATTSVKYKPTDITLLIARKTDITLLIARIVKTESCKKMITLQHLHDSSRESYVKNNSLVLVQENIERVKKLGVVIGESGRSLGVVHT